MQKLVGPLLERLTTFVFPFLLIGLAVVALVMQAGRFENSAGRQLELRVWEDSSPSGTSSAQLASTKLDAVPPTKLLETHLSTRPFWIALSVARDTPVIDFPSRHAMALSCWDAESGVVLGSGNRSTTGRLMSTSRAGFSLDLEGVATRSLLCVASFRGPAKISAEGWTHESLESSHLAHHRSGIMIEAAIGMLAVFMLLTALVNKSRLYLTFVGWLLLNMRMAGISAGTDFVFFGYQIPADYLIAVRQLTVCSYFAITIVLFNLLFSKELKKFAFQLPLHILQVSALTALVLGPLLPFEAMLVGVWLGTVIGVAVIFCYLILILVGNHSRVAGWYVASMAVTLGASLNEVIAAALDQRALLIGLNSVSAAIASALLASAAVAEHMRTHRLQTLKAQQLLEAAYQGSPIGLFSVGDGVLISKMNPAFESLMRVEPKSSPIRLPDFFDSVTVKKIAALHLEKTGGTIELQTSVESEDGLTRRWFAIRASTVDGSIIECSLQDITERVSATERLEFLASHDPLTGCLNLRGLGQLAGASQQRPVALAYFDLDRFKLINDLYGHTAGDLVLKQVAERMRRVLQPGDLLARIGGDEFVVVFYQGNMPECEAKCNTITTLIGSAPFQIESQSFALDVSAGLVGTDQFKYSELKEIVSAADTLCRIAKKRSHQRMVVMESGDRFFQQHQDELDLINCLERGETPEGLFLVMQPEVSLSRPFDSLNFEMLIRLRKADGTIVPAGTIIEAAEAHGKTAIIDRWVVNTAIRWLEAHTHELRNTHFVGVNLSGGSLNDELFTEELFALFKQHPVALEKICIEITETVAITDMRNMQRFIDRVRSMGGKVALDDFGAGYSSFGYLKGLSVDSLKLDGSLVRDAVRSQAGQAIIVAIAGLVSSLGMKSVGEFAEDLPTIKVLYEAGIDYAQGYGISKPVEADRILAARSGADFVEDPEILAFLKQLQSQEEPSMRLFSDSAFSSVQ